MAKQTYVGCLMLEKHIPGLYVPIQGSANEPVLFKMNTFYYILYSKAIFKKCCYKN